MAIVSRTRGRYQVVKILEAEYQVLLHDVRELLDDAWWAQAISAVNSRISPRAKTPHSSITKIVSECDDYLYYVTLPMMQIGYLRRILQMLPAWSAKREARKMQQIDEHLTSFLQLWFAETFAQLEATFPGWDVFELIDKELDLQYGDWLEAELNERYADLLALAISVL